jgi:peptidoglycan hydrolase-like protein with peptidoglycan-binding domain
MKRLSIAPAVCVSLALLVAGCSSDDKGAPTSLGGASSNPTTTTTNGSPVTAASGGTTSTSAPTTVTAGTGSSVESTSTTAAAGSRVVTSPSDNVRLGDTGDGVSQIQTALKALGYDLQPDGQFGPVTDRAVRDYQSKNSLTVDGVVGPKTWEKLGAGVNGSAESTTTTTA